MGRGSRRANLQLQYNLDVPFDGLDAAGLGVVLHHVLGIAWGRIELPAGLDSSQSQMDTSQIEPKRFAGV